MSSTRPTRSPSWSLSWPLEVTRLTRRIAVLELEARLDRERGPQLRRQARHLTAQLERIKTAIVAGEIRGVIESLVDLRQALDRAIEAIEPLDAVVAAWMASAPAAERSQDARGPGTGCPTDP